MLLLATTTCYDDGVLFKEAWLLAEGGQGPDVKSVHHFSHAYRSEAILQLTREPGVDLLDHNPFQVMLKISMLLTLWPGSCLAGALRTNANAFLGGYVSYCNYLNSVVGNYVILLCLKCGNTWTIVRDHRQE